MPDTDFLNLLKSIILPVDEDSLRSVLVDVRQDLQETSWIQLFHRIEGVAVLLLIPGLLVFGGVIVYEIGISWEYLKTIGLQYAFGVLLLIFIFSIKFILRLVNKINDGDSIWGTDEDNILSLVFQAAISLGFITGTGATIYYMNVSLYAVVEVFVIILVLLGSFLAGVSGIITTFLLLFGIK